MSGTTENIFSSSLPYLTKDLPGIGGILKKEPEDFVVEEIPAYLPEGDGDHLFLWIEKKGISTEELVRHFSRKLGIPRREIGSAGLKDRQAVARQYISIPAEFEDQLSKADADFFSILHLGLHRNKLKTGHLKGNRFQLLVRDPSENAMEHCQSIRESILQNGFPNFYGTQRFGKNNQTIEQGLELLQYPDSEKSRKLKRNRSLLRLSLSALQSALFNNALIERISENLIHQVLDGDVMKVTLTGGVFIVENLETEQERFNQHEIVTTGPIYGPKMKQPGDQVREREAAILESAGLKEDIFKAYRKLTAGTRRPFLIWPEEIEINPEKDGICFEFELPSGVYATSLMREFMKTDENQA